MPGESEPEVTDSPPAEAPDEADAPQEDAGWVDLLSSGSTVAVSSVYRDEVRQVQRLWDGDLETAWNSATMEEGDDTPQWIAVRLPETVQVHAIELTAGYTRTRGDSDLFAQNRRIRRVRVRHGAETFESELDIDSRELQRIEVNGNGGDWRIELLEWEDGTRPSFRELVVSELRVLGDSGDVPTGRRARAWLGELPPVDLQPLANELVERLSINEAGAYSVPLDDEVESDTSPAQLARLVRPGRVHVGRFEEGEASVSIRLRPRECHAIVGLVMRSPTSEGAEADVEFGTHPNEIDRQTDPERATEFLIGVQSPICPEDEVLTETLSFSDVGARWYAYAVFEQEGINADGSRQPAPGEMGGAEMVEREGLRLSELTLAPEMEGREPADPRGTYVKEVDERIYCFFRLDNPDAAATSVSLSWEDEGGNSRREPTIIDVPAQRRYTSFRYTSTSWRRAGPYSCVIRDESGEEIGRIRFALSEADQ